MTNLLSNGSNGSSIPSSATLSVSSSSDRRDRMAALILTLAGGTLGLMALGSATRVMNAGLSCPDWPLCYGEFIPQAQMNLQVFLEWFHRLVATTIGFSLLVISTVAWRWRQSLPSWLPWGLAGAIALVLVQGILGGLTVTQLLRFDIVTAHLGTGLAFFSTLLTIGLCLLPYRASGHTGSLRFVGLTAAILVYLQSLLGGLVASQWAVHQCFDRSQLCTIMNSHIIGVVPATVATLTLLTGIGWQAYRYRDMHIWISRAAIAVGLMLALQIALGITTFRLRLQVEVLTVFHQAIGAALLGLLITCTVLAFRTHRQAG
jgi:heme a synthase